MPQQAYGAWGFFLLPFADVRRARLARAPDTTTNTPSRFFSDLFNTHTNHRTTRFTFRCVCACLLVLDGCVPVADSAGRTSSSSQPTPRPSPSILTHPHLNYPTQHEGELAALLEPRSGELWC